VLPYLVAEALMIAGAIALASAPETVLILERRPRYQPQRVSVPPTNRPVFFAATASNALAFAVTGVFASVAPSVIAGVLHDTSHAVAGGTAFVVFGISAGVQLLVSRCRAAPWSGSG